MTVSAPSKFLGDLSSFFGGSISFDARDVNGVASDLLSPGPWFGTVTITGTSGTSMATFAGTAAGQPPADGQWHPYSRPLLSGVWSGNFPAVLSNVTGIAVQLEFNNAMVEKAGLDNFTLSAVPESGIASLLLCGLMAVAGVTRRKKNLGRSGEQTH